jgi:hypothetical protein
MSVATPVETRFGTGLESEGKNARVDVPYRSVTGSLMYLAVNSRPDIAYVTSVLSQYNTTYNKQHWKYAKPVLWCLKVTVDYCLEYRKCDQIDITGSVYSDWAGDPLDRKSYSGYLFKLGEGLVLWEAKCSALWPYYVEKLSM